MSRIPLPSLFFERVQRIVPADQVADVLQSFQSPRPTAFRINTLRAGREAVLSSLENEGLKPAPVTWYADAFTVQPEKRAALLASAPYLEQKIYVQNLSSMVPPLELDLEPGLRVLDLAAAPGSKTIQMACLMENEGELAAVEVVKKRFFKLRDNLERQGATMVRTFLKDGGQVWRHRSGYFDRVLLDAPCSGSGRFHVDDPDSFAYWKPQKIKEMVRKQRRLLSSAFQCMRPGGIMVYATCSLGPEENEAVLSRLLKRFDGQIEILPLTLDLPNMQPAMQEWGGTSFNSSLSLARRILPVAGMEGFFVCKMRKVEPASN